MERKCKKMKRLKTWGRRWLLGLMFLLLGIFLSPKGEVQAASSYTNAREFYESIADENHTEIHNGDIYYATCGKLAAPTSTLRYYTVGRDITLSGNGVSVSFGVKRNGVMQEVSDVKSGGYQYMLYRISCQDLVNLLYARNASAAETIIKSDSILIRIDNIMTTKSNGVLNGGVSEDGHGGLNEWGTIYHMRDDGDWAAAKKVFAGHDFASFRNIRQKLENFTMTIRYNTAGGRAAGRFHTVEDTEGRTILCQDGKQVETKTRLMQKSAMIDPDNISLSNSPQLVKTGYHLTEGKKWTNRNRYYDAGISYQPREIHDEAGLRDINIIMTANWQPNTYTIRYDANGGTGLMGDQLCTYDTPAALRAMTYSREGYTFREWNTKADGSGTGYSREYENQHTLPIQNLTEVNGGVVTLYAIWEPDLYKILTVKDGGTGIYLGGSNIQGGADQFYEKYETSWCGDSQGKNEISKIEVPALYGYEFLGYYTNISGTGGLVVDAKGNFAGNPGGSALEQQVANKTIFWCDSVVYANWQPKQSRIIFDKQGGSGGSDQVTAVYGEVLPYADGPQRDGWEFQGYYTQPQGKGICYYNENMAGMRLWDKENDITLYACWKDTTAPDITLTASTSAWSNRTITLDARAWDLGSGLDRVEIYLGSTKVAQQTDLGGAIRNFELDGGSLKGLIYDNKKEGAIRYRAVAYDRNGLWAEAWCTVYSDITAPKGMDRKWSFDGYTIGDSLFVTDYVSILER